jgi:DNA polymerase delta subunit 2
MEVQPPQQQRAFCAHQPKWQRFQTSLLVASTQSAAATAASKAPVKVDVHPYQRQYAHVYHERLEVLGPRCWENIPEESKDGTNKNSIARVARILELQEGLLSAAVGTLVKEQSTDAAKGEETLHPDSKCCASDALFLEDTSGRVALEFPKDTGDNHANVHNYCTGMVVGVVGIVGADGVLIIQSVHHPVAAPDSESASDTTSDTADTDNEAPHILFLSGLQCGGAHVSSLPRELLVSYLEGRFSAANAARVSRVVIAGGSCSSSGESMSASVKELDAFLLQVAGAGIPIDILPGQDDPVSANWPQRPLHRSLLKQSVRYCSQIVNRTPNPYAAVVGIDASSKLLVGTDGANVQDLARRLLVVSTETTNDDDAAMDTDTKKEETAAATSTFHPVSELQALERTLTAGHICPTGPDSVPTIPHPSEDPMVLTVTPDIYFAGNCSKFATSLVVTTTTTGGNSSSSSKLRQKRLVCLPKFGETGEAVLVNMETLGVELLCFEE